MSERPMTFEEVRVTPPMAKRWLERNESNRKVSRARVNAYARDMAAGHWARSPHGIVFNENGDLLDGQHRLHAIVAANVAIRMLVVRGADHDVRLVIDRGRVRSMADALTMAGEKNAHLKASIVRWLRILDGAEGTGDVPTTAGGMETIEKYSPEFAWLDAQTPERGVTKRAPIVAAVLWSRSIAPAVVDAFYDRASDGIGVVSGSGAHALRSHIVRMLIGRARNSARDLVLRTCNCIEADIAGRPVGKLFASAVGYLALCERKGAKPGVLGEHVSKRSATGDDE